MSYSRIRAILIALVATASIVSILEVGSMKRLSRHCRFSLFEDSPLVRDRLDAAVNAAGGVVVGHSAAANDAIENLATVHPDVVIVDIQLRSGTGFDVLEALQTSGDGRSATKIVLTNHASAEYRDRSFQLGANAFFDKSSETLQLFELIHQLAA